MSAASDGEQIVDRKNTAIFLQPRDVVRHVREHVGNACPGQFAPPHKEQCTQHCAAENAEFF